MKIKLFVAYLLTLAALLLVGYVAYRGLQQLMQTLEEASEPAEEEFWVDKIFETVLEAENDIRVFTITKDKQYLEPYRRSVEKLKVYLSSLKKIKVKDSSVWQNIDSLDVLLHKKIEVQEQLINLYQSTNIPDAYQELYEEIDEMEAERKIQDSIAAEEEKHTFLSNIFKSEREADSDSLVQEISGKIKQSIQQLQQSQRQLQRNLIRRELLLTKRDRLISDLIADKVEFLKRQLDIIDRDRAMNASNSFQKTTNYITIIGTAAAILILLFIFLLFRDYQVILQTKKALELAREKSDQLARAKEEFLANMSHEIRTPLNAIIGFTGQLVNGHASEKYNSRYLHIVHNASQYLLSLLNNVLDYSKLAAGKMQIDQVDFEPNMLVEEIAPLLRPYAEEKNLVMEWEVSESLAGKILHADLGRIKQIMFNLISNAIKYTQKGGVHIDLSWEDKWLVITITDTGKGFTEEEKQHLFEQYHTKENAEKQKWGSTGLGLYIVYQVVELLEGNIKVESTPNSGTTFSISIPASELKEMAQQETTIEKDQFNLKAVRLLVADDDAYNLQLLETILHKWHGQVTAVNNGALLLNQWQQEHFDIILVDLQMPVLNGLEASEKIRERDDETPIIALTAHLDSIVKQTCHAHGINEVLTKPFSEHQLRHILAKYIHRFSENEESTDTAHEAESSLDKEDNAFHQKMTVLYKKSIKQFFKDINEALMAKDIAAIKRLAHKVIPSTEHMGFPLFLEILKALDVEDSGQDATYLEHADEARAEAARIIDLLETKLNI